VTPELTEDLYLLAEADVRGKGKEPSADLSQLSRLRAHVARVLASGAAFNVKDLAISGRDLSQELGLRPGPAFGEILRTLLDEVVEDPALNERSRLLARAAELAKPLAGAG
jgi:tRNA nucleotidyltransferase (CCA-adding enzyme)